MQPPMNADESNVPILSFQAFTEPSIPNPALDSRWIRRIVVPCMTQIFGLIGVHLPE
jgi:hypothetical protein